MADLVMLLLQSAECESRHPRSRRAVTTADRNTDQPLPQAPPLGVSGASPQGHESLWRGCAEFSELGPALAFNPAQTFQKTMQIERITHRSRSEDWLKIGIIHGKALSLTDQGQ